MTSIWSSIYQELRVNDQKSRQNQETGYTEQLYFFIIFWFVVWNFCLLAEKKSDLLIVWTQHRQIYREGTHSYSSYIMYFSHAKYLKTGFWSKEIWEINDFLAATSKIVVTCIHMEKNFFYDERFFRSLDFLTPAQLDI